MTIENDETLQIFIEESIEHLADIENDFLAIEEAGADIDEDMVNKVYRAAHSIKGGAGFMGLDNIKNLTHEIENILGKIRSREMVPNPEIVNVLLLASDAVRNLINDVFNSNEIDISEHVAALKSIIEGSLQQEVKEADLSVSDDALPAEEEHASGTADDLCPDVKVIFPAAKEAVSNAQKEGKHVYLIELDLIHDVQMKNKQLFAFIQEMQQTGIILDGKIDMKAVGVLNESSLPDRLPFTVLFATIFQSEDVNMLFEIDKKNIWAVSEDLGTQAIDKTSQAEPVLSIKDKTESPAVEQAKEKVADEPIKKSQDSTTMEKKTQLTKSPVVAKSPVVDTSLRVHVSLLDSLMTLAGELVLSRNQLVQTILANDHRLLEVAGQRIDMITTELQEAIMLTRMQSIGNVFNKFQRIVRDLARNLGKKVELEIQGKDVELDKTIIEAIGDPLTHLVRNSVDHGIETPDDRHKAGKKPTGKILLKAYHEAGQVNIVISDDGKGLDGDKLAETAVDKGFITEDQLKMMSEKEKVSLIFLPGFSMAKKVTDVSGRGVGMDVVKTNLDKVGGVTDIDSRLGKGTTIRIKLPLTLAIIPCQIISTGGERYAVPQVNMEELLRISADQIKDRIERVGDAEVVRLRGNLLPLIRLADVIGVERIYFDPEEEKEKQDRRINIADRRSKKSDIATSNEQRATSNEQSATRNREDRRYHADSALNIVVVSAGALKYGLVVDQLHDPEEIVVKPLGRHLKNCKGYAGATIMGDGRVALILDVAGIAGMAELTSVEGTDRAAEVKKEKAKSQDDLLSLLIFRNAEDEQFAVPLSLVSRIEKVKKEEIEMVGGKKVIQYRGESLPLIAIDDVANVKPLADREKLLVIVFLISGKEVGLLATDPVDAMEVLSAGFDESTLKQTGIMGSAIIDNYTTQMVDIFGLMETVNPDWFSGRDAVQTSDGKMPTILYAEDSGFFRAQVKSFMEDEGYNVIEAEDGMIAWNLLQEHADEISLVVTDVEMPNLDGLGLARKIKGDAQYSHLPIIALTTLAGEDEIARGKAVGIDDYQVKLDQERLLESLHGWLK